MTIYRLPKLNYGFKELEPFMSEEQLRIHYEKHHSAYINGANALIEKLDKGRKDNVELDFKAIAKELSWNIAGNKLHLLFWTNLIPPKKFTKPSKFVVDAIEKEFGSWERFKLEFNKVALSVEGSGWCALVKCSETGRLFLMQVEKHNVNVHPMHRILLVVDVFEHAYYIDYKNDRAKFLENFWSIINWKEVEDRVKK